MNIKITAVADGPYASNCYVVKSGDEGIIIDPSSNPQRIVYEQGIKTVKYIIVTHAHIDHIFALDEVKKSTGAKIAVGENDFNAINNSVLNLAEMFGAAVPETKADIALHGGDELLFGNTKIKIISTPGHTCGGISLYTDGCVFTGDTLFKESVGRTDFYGGSYESLMSSIKDKLYKLPDNTFVYPGHGESSQIGYEKKNNFYVV